MKVLALLALCWMGPLLAQDGSQTATMEHSTFTSVGDITIYKDFTLVLPELRLTADEASANQKTGVITALGNVKIDYHANGGTIEITAHEITYDQANRSGICTQVTAQFQEDFFFEGASLEILNGGDRYLIQDGQITACNQALAQWSMKIRKATVEREGYAYIHGASFRIKGVPILYFPYFIAPAMQERRSGLLTPDVGNTARNGLFYGQPFYWAPRQDLDLTFAPYVYEEAGFRLDLEARYTPDPTTSGHFQGRYFADQVMRDLLAENRAPIEDGKPLDKNRFRANWQHDQAVLGGHFQVDVEAGSDFGIDRDFLQETARTRLRDYYYRAGYDHRLGNGMIQLRVDRLERILSDADQVQSLDRLPDLRIVLPPQAMGHGFYLRNYFYGGLYRVEDLGLLPDQDDPAAPPKPLTDHLMRLGLDTEISRGQNWAHFLHSRWGARYQGSYYTIEDRDVSTVNGGAFAFLETVGPRVQRVYNTRKRRTVHYLDLGLIIKLGTRDEEEHALPDTFQFDELDIRIDEQVNGLRTAWRLNSRLFSGPVGKSRPLLDVEVRQEAVFGNEDNRPIETRFRLLNYQGFHGHGLFQVDPDTGQFDTMSVYGSVDRGHWTGYGGYVKKQPDAESFIGISQWSLPQLRSRFKLALDYDLGNHEFKSQEILYGYQGQCVGVSINYIKAPYDTSTKKSRDYLQFTLNLKNLSELGARF